MSTYEVQEDFDTVIIGGDNKVANPNFVANTNFWTASGVVVPLTAGGVSIKGTGSFYHTLNTKDVASSVVYTARCYCDVVSGTATMTVGSAASDSTGGTVTLATGWNSFSFTAGTTNVISFNLTTARVNVFQVEVRSMKSLAITGDLILGNDIVLDDVTCDSITSTGLIKTSGKIETTSTATDAIYSKGGVKSTIASDTDSDTNDVLTTTIANTDYGLVVVRESIGTEACVYLIAGGTIEKIGTDATFTVTKDNASTYNVYFEDNVIKVQNKVGDNKNIAVGLYAI
jgi:hypothetical protein